MVQVRIRVANAPGIAADSVWCFSDALKIGETSKKYDMTEKEVQRITAPAEDAEISGQTSNAANIPGEELVNTSDEISGCQILGYGIGHFYNDLCASMWFTYLLLFLEKVVNIRSSVAGLIMLLGQATDALSTALIGFISDWTSAPFCLRRCGQRKSWHAAGTVLVTFSFAFIYNKCFLCSNTKTDWSSFIWYTPFVIVFQIGWAAVQAILLHYLLLRLGSFSIRPFPNFCQQEISHLALLPELTSDESRRTTMNSVRYGSTVAANLTVFAMLSILFHLHDSGSTVGPNDLKHFSTAAIAVIVLGLFTQIIFYTVTKEPSRVRHASESHQLGIFQSFKLSLLKWMCRDQFYQVGILYMFCRLYINLSQVYFPFYITHVRNLSTKYVAVLPTVSYCSSLVVSSLVSLPFLNRRLSLKVLALFGCVCGIANCLAMQFDAYLSIYVIAAVLGAAQAVLLITSLSVVAELISQDTESGAFVYGSLSSMDKISNGVAMQVIELFSPSSCITSESLLECAKFYRVVVVVVPGSCLVVAVFVILSLILREKCYLSPQTNTQGDTERLVEDSSLNSDQ